MASEPLRVVCYVNQFFGQLGGEERAGLGPQAMDGAVGAARAVQQALGNAGTVVTTVICGDNYAAEQGERAVAELVALVAAARPDLVIAGPAFLAGRYGVACGALCAAVQTQLEVPAVTGMQAENPGVDLYRRQVYIVQTGAEATRMLGEVKRLVAFGLKLARGEAIGTPAAEGYFARGVTRNVVAGANAADRATAMLLDRLAGRPFTSEVPRPAFPSVSAYGWSVRRRVIASARMSGSRGGTRMPVRPWSIISGMPPTADATTGLPSAMASRIDRPWASR